MKTKSWIVIPALAAFLAGCGGSDGAPPAPPASPIAVSGTAATGAPMAGATVSLLCNNGGPATTATADASGKYTMSIPATCTAPYMLKATGGGITLYAFADTAGNINVTPFTDIAAGIATGGNTEAEYAFVLAASKKVGDFWSTTKGQEIRAKLLARLQSLGISLAGVSDFLHAVFEAKPGDKLDDALEALRTARGSLPLSSIVEQFVAAGGTPMDRPWLTLFKPGVASRSIVATGCSYTPEGGGAEPAGTATITLTPSGDRLLASASASGMPAVEPLEIGGEGSSFLLLYGLGTSLGSNVGGIASSGLVSMVWFDDGAASSIMDLPPLAVATPGGSLQCSQLAQGVSRSSLHAFDMAARTSAVVGTATNVVSPPGGCGLPNTDPAQTYTYAVSPLGEFTVNGLPFTPAGMGEAGAYAGYFDGFDWPVGGERTARASINTLVVFQFAMLSRKTSGAFTHECSSAPSP